MFGPRAVPQPALWLAFLGTVVALCAGCGSDTGAVDPASSLGPGAGQLRVVPDPQPSASRDVVPPDGVFTLSLPLAAGSDLTGFRIAWSADAGAFLRAAGTDARWKAPSDETTATLGATLTHPNGSAQSVRLSVLVTADPYLAYGTRTADLAARVSDLSAAFLDLLLAATLDTSVDLGADTHEVTAAQADALSVALGTFTLAVNRARLAAASLAQLAGTPSALPPLTQLSWQDTKTFLQTLPSRAFQKLTGLGKTLTGHADKGATDIVELIDNATPEQQADLATMVREIVNPATNEPFRSVAEFKGVVSGAELGSTAYFALPRWKRQACQIVDAVECGDKEGILVGMDDIAKETTRSMLDDAADVLNRFGGKVSKLVKAAARLVKGGTKLNEWLKPDDEGATADVQPDGGGQGDVTVLVVPDDADEPITTRPPTTLPPPGGTIPVVVPPSKPAKVVVVPKAGPATATDPVTVAKHAPMTVVAPLPPAAPLGSIALVPESAVVNAGSTFRCTVDILDATGLPAPYEVRWIASDSGSGFTTTSATPLEASVIFPPGASAVHVAVEVSASNGHSASAWIAVPAVAGDDEDNDGSPAADDCDDFDADVAPGLSEVAGDRKDNDCDGVIDEPAPGVLEGRWDVHVRYDRVDIHPEAESLGASFPFETGGTGTTEWTFTRREGDAESYDISDAAGVELVGSLAGSKLTISGSGEPATYNVIEVEGVLMARAAGVYVGHVRAVTHFDATEDGGPRISNAAVLEETVTLSR